MRIKEKDYSTSTVNYVRDKYSNIENNFTLAYDIVDTSISMNVGANDILASAYGDNGLLPYNVITYNQNMITATNLILPTLTDVEQTTLGDLYTTVDACVLNLISGINPFTGFEYDTIEMDNTGASLIENITHYLSTGSDGDITLTNQFTMIKNVFNFTTYPDLKDYARYPIVTVVDPGYPLSVKYAMLDYATVREDAFVALGTYQYASDTGVAMAELTKAEDLAMGHALYQRAALVRESTLFGTPAVRVAIFCQSGVSIDSVKNTVVPTTYWFAAKVAEKYNSTYLKSSLTPYPNNINDLFLKLNWVPSDLSFKQSLWNEKLNYCQYFDNTQLFFPAFQTVYSNNTSKLTDLEFILVACFTKQLAHTLWAKRTGADEDVDVRLFNTQSMAQEDVNKMLNGKYPCTVECYQTEDEIAEGGIDHVQYIYTPSKVSDVFRVDIVVQKPTAS